MTASSVEQAVLNLPMQDRARLVQVLLDSLDGDGTEADIQQLWIETSQRRAGEIDQGTVTLVDSETLEAKVQALLR